LVDDDGLDEVGIGVGVGVDDPPFLIAQRQMASEELPKVDEQV
jgi:hypothetical protein